MLDRSKCKKMLVWSSSESEAIERIVIDMLNDGWCITVHKDYEKNFVEGKCYEICKYRNCKPIPEQKPVTILDVMYKAGVRDVFQYDNTPCFYDVRSIISEPCNLEGLVFNELIKESNEVKLKHKTWLTAEQYVRGQ
jgi:hypothetical protein